MALPILKNPELVIALVCPAGTDVAMMKEVVKSELREVGYTCHDIKLSRILLDLPEFRERLKKHAEDGKEPARIIDLMTAGDDLRRSVEDGAALAVLGMAKIQEAREENAASSQRRAYLIDSLKHPDEIRALRVVYGPFLLVVSVAAPRDMRIAAMAQRIARSRHTSDAVGCRNDAETIIQRDTIGSDGKFGQNVRDAFPLGDVFVRLGTRDFVAEQMRRFIEAWFGHPFHTPTMDEVGMAHARAAALRSADLSRQVGAAILSPDGDILAVGCNEVPRPGGGAFWEGESAEHDDRDFRHGIDPSVAMKTQILGEILEQFRGVGALSPAWQEKPVDKLVEELAGKRSILKDTRVAGLIEFGRIVHAEMSAIMNATRRGVALAGTTLVCTTFPCHMCARHIIAAGITRVISIEPYPKSLAKQLYGRSITVDGDSAGPDAIRFDSFIGVSPDRYPDFFSIRCDRKRPDGRATSWNKTSAFPPYPMLIDLVSDNEDLALKALLEARQARGLHPPFQLNSGDTP